MAKVCRDELNGLLQGLYGWRMGGYPSAELSRLEDRYRQCRQAHGIRDDDLDRHFRSLYTSLLLKLDRREMLAWVTNKQI
jgi:hypothetical protein